MEDKNFYLDSYNWGDASCLVYLGGLIYPEYYFSQFVGNTEDQITLSFSSLTDQDNGCLNIKEFSNLCSKNSICIHYNSEDDHFCLLKIDWSSFSKKSIDNWLENILKKQLPKNYFEFIEELKDDEQ